ncbi:hypothetical protein QFC24_001852 [Naganishia onofrii]|uniref:Uncharacterized protein n=1 Tax=Naganishia onofrii TaxID=1851511 RepID=A0ACC2XS26_9TREE|nr:hypothetical protein QFC24_001852 [Naganishia onofrii]
MTEPSSTSLVASSTDLEHLRALYKGYPGERLIVQKCRPGAVKQVFPTLDLLGWYTIGPEPADVDSHIHQQFTSILETPIFLQLSPNEPETSPSRTNGEIPVRIFESALGASDNTNTDEQDVKFTRTKFIELKYSVETGEAERIAVDGAAKAGGDDGIGGSALATLPVMTESGFQDEFLTEYSDVQLTAYLATLTKSLATLNDLTDRFNAVYQKDNGPSAKGGNPEFANFGRSLGSGGRREHKYRR